MTTTLTVRDETTTGDSFEAITLEFLTDEITVRELIRERVYQEVKDYNTGVGESFRGLVQPTDSEATPRGFKLKTRREVGWELQFERACDAFEQRRVLVLIDDHQAQSLDERLTLRPDTTVSFIKLVPLVGG